MPKFDEHLAQAQHNLSFLSTINQHSPTVYDWQVTVCFYAALHLVNGHLSTKGLKYRSHSDVNDAINPTNPASISRFPEAEYKAYQALFSLSRRARYLTYDQEPNNLANLTYDKHLCRAVRHLDCLMAFFNGLYPSNPLPKFPLKCVGLNYTGLNHFIPGK